LIVRFELVYYTLSPKIKVIAPWRMPEFYDRFAGRNDLSRLRRKEWNPSHQHQRQAIEYGYIFVIFENLAHCSYEAGILEDPDVTPPADMWKLTMDPMKAPDKPEDFTVVF
jgi:argininosuccinate synthase